MRNNENKNIINELTHIFYVHNGISDYLEISLKEAKLKNPNCKLILLGDESNNLYEYVIHENSKKYNHYADEFDKRYIHLSDKNYEYELFCFKRWFIILDYMKKNGIPVGYYQDSDVILDYNINELEYDNKYWYCDCSGHTSVFTVEILEKLCEFILDYYSSEEKILHLFKMRAKMKQIDENPKWTNITDMELISLFIFENNNIVKNIGIRNDKRIFGFNINAKDHTNAFHMSQYRSIKDKNKIYCINNKLYVKDSVLNKTIRLCSVHFHSENKKYMKSFIEYNSLKTNYNEILYFDFDSEKWVSDNNENKLVNYKVISEVLYHQKDKRNNEYINNVIEKLLHEKVKNINYHELEKYISTKVTMLAKENYMELYEKLNLENKKVIGWGTGNGLNILNKYYSCKFEYLVDSDRSKIGKKFKDIEICDIANIIKEDKNNIFVIVLSSSYYVRIRDFLKGIGLEENVDFINIDVLIGFFSKVIDK